MLVGPNFDHHLNSRKTTHNIIFIEASNSTRDIRNKKTTTITLIKIEIALY